MQNRQNGALFFEWVSLMANPYLLNGEAAMAENESTAGIRKRKIILFTILFFFILGLVAIWYCKYMAGHSKKGILTLHGWVEGTEVSLSSKVRGNIIKLPIDEGYDVKKDDLMAQIDSEQINAQLDAASAKVKNAEDLLKKAKNDVLIFKSKVKGAEIALDLSQQQSSARIGESEAMLSAMKEHLKQAEFNYDKAQKDYIRFSALVKKKKISESKMDSIDEVYKVTKAGVERAGKDIEKSKASLALAKTSISDIKLKKNEIETLKRELAGAVTEVDIASTVLESARAKKKEIKADVVDTFINTPVNGTIIEKFVEIGEHVVPGTPVALIIDMSQLYIKTYVEQIYIGKIKYGDLARIYVDSFPDRYFEGKVTLIAPKAEFTPRDVQMDEHRSRIVYKVEVGIDNPEGVLKPGMPADVDLKWDKDQPWT